MRSNNTEVQLLKLAQTMKVYFVDQCISNYFYKNDVTYFPLTWNYQINDKERQDFGLLRSLPVKTLNTVLETRKSPKIVHFSGPFKPWFYPAEEYADIWWKYARQTPFYEEILAQMVNFKAGNTMSANNEIAKLRDEFTKIHFPNINNTFALQKKEIQFLFITQHLLAFRLKKIRYLLKKVFSFGKTHAKYQRKYESLKTLIKEAKRFKKRIRKI
jgi:lipopolysaccharide biosynthesis glycosyltransferase